MDAPNAVVQALANEVVLLVKTALAPVHERLAAIDARLGDDAATRVEVAALRERLAVSEVRSLVAGPPGRDGRDGTNGADGFALGDLVVTPTGDRTFELSFVRGDERKPIGAITIPVPIYRGVHLDGRLYEKGDLVTWAGAMWHCQEATTSKPGDGSKAWILCVKRGRDGRDLVPPDPNAPAPVVTVPAARGRM